MIESISLVLCDVDGVLTDGHVVVDEHGTETKQFHVLDGSAAVNLAYCGLTVGLITGRQSRAVWHWARGLKIRDVHQGVADKLATAERLAARYEVPMSQVAYIGDDLLDAKLLRAVGFSACPADARPEIAAIVDYVSPILGGRGVLRDVSEAILKAQGRWLPLLRERYGVDGAPPPA